MEKAGKKVVNLVVLAAGSEAAKAVGEWNNKASQKSLLNPDRFENRMFPAITDFSAICPN